MIKPLNLKKDKRGALGIIFFFVALFSILVIGFLTALVVVVIGFGSDELTAVVQDIGDVSGTNISAVAEYTIVPFNDIIQKFGLLAGVGYIMSLISVVVFVVAYRQTQNLIFVGMFFGLLMLLLLGAIIISNAYEEIYSGTDEIADRLHDLTILSYALLYSPHILAVIGFIGGIFMFSGKKEDDLGL